MPGFAGKTTTACLGLGASFLLAVCASYAQSDLSITSSDKLRPLDPNATYVLTLTCRPGPRFAQSLFVKNDYKTTLLLSQDRTQGVANGDTILTLSQDHNHIKGIGNSDLTGCSESCSFEARSPIYLIARLTIVGTMTSDFERTVPLKEGSYTVRARTGDNISLSITRANQGYPSRTCLQGIQ
jgi:hypothetical protein